MSKIGQSVVSWVDSNLVAVAKNALLQNHMVGWGGRFEYGKSVPVGVAVLYIDKVMLSVSDTQADLPTEGAKGFELLVDLKHMRVGDDPFISRTIEFKKAGTREQAIASCAMRYAAMRIQEKVCNSDIEGFSRWKGIYNSGARYVEGDLVAYKGFVYRCTGGSGSPATTGSWKQLDGRSIATGIAINTTTED